MRVVIAILCLIVLFALAWAVQHDAAGLMSAMPPAARDYVGMVVGVGFWLAAAWVATALLRVTVLQLAKRGRAQNKLPKFLVDVGAIVIFFVAGLLILSQVFGYSLGGVLATSGVLAAVIGFAVQKTIADIIAGIALNLEQSMKIGDWIELPTGVIGQAVEITWRTTHLYTRDGRLVVVPNSTLIGGQFSNISAPQRFLRVTKRVEIDYNVPPPRVIGILQSAMKATAGVLEKPESIVYIDECAESGIVYSLNYWVADYPESFLISRQVLANALEFLDRAGISPVYPKRDITVFQAGTRHIDHRIDVAALLARISFFRFLSAEALQDLARECHVREIAPDTVVVHEGDAGTSLFVVIAGLLDVSKADERRGQQSVGRLMPGDVFGEMSLLTGAPRTATVTAAAHAILVEIGKSQIEPILTGHPEAIAALSELMAQRAAINESILALWPQESRAIATMGVAGFLRERITRFFGRALPR